MATRKRVIRRMSEEAPRYVPGRLEKPVQTAKLFRNGRSQAVRLPREFRFEGDEVYVRREGKSVVLTPKVSRKAADKASREAEWQDFFDALDSFDPRFPLERHQPEHQVRKSVGMTAPPRRRTRAK